MVRGRLSVGSGHNVYCNSMPDVVQMGVNDVIQIRLGRKRATDWKRFLKRTGLSQGELIRAAVDSRIKATQGGLPPVAARWAGKVKGSGIAATNRAVAREMKG